MRQLARLLGIIALAAMSTACATATATAGPSGPPPLPPASDFTRVVDNPWFPLEPGTVLTYKGEDDGIPARDIFRVTHRVERILGIHATVVDDRVYEQGRLRERTHDYYAQDRQGNVWY